MDQHRSRISVISDFNAELFRRCLNSDTEPPLLESVSLPMGQGVHWLLDGQLDHFVEDCAIVWTKPQNVIPSFTAVQNLELVNMSQLLAEVDRYAKAIIHLRQQLRYVLVATWTLPSYYRGYGMLDMANGVGVRNLLTRMNLRLADNFANEQGIYLLDAQRWLENAQGATNEKLWYLSKVPFGLEVFQSATKDIKAAALGINGGTRKLVIVDLDDTLWGGTLGESGWERLNLGGHNAVGEALGEFQRGLKSLTNRGILLGIVSKNVEADALEAIEKHPEMILRLKDFAGWKIDWHDKVENIISLASQINVGLNYIVFIDDNPMERARVREALPEICVPEWPANKLMYPSALMRLTCFDAPVVSQEDRERTKLYALERERQTLKVGGNSLDEWLSTLETKVTVEELNEANLERATQLLNKTNQMNLTTRRMTTRELWDWAKGENHKFWTFRVSDRLGDSGLTGLLSIETKGNIGQVVDFVLSCRVVGRKIEEAMLFTVIAYSQKNHLTEVIAQFIPTPKNERCLAFLRESGFQETSIHLFRWSIAREYRLPAAIHLERSDIHSPAAGESQWKLAQR